MNWIDCIILSAILCAGLSLGAFVFHMFFTNNQFRIIVAQTVIPILVVAVFLRYKYGKEK